MFAIEPQAAEGTNSKKRWNAYLENRDPRLSEQNSDAVRGCLFATFRDAAVV